MCRKWIEFVLVEPDCCALLVNALHTFHTVLTRIHILFIKCCNNVIKCNPWIKFKACQTLKNFFSSVSMCNSNFVTLHTFCIKVIKAWRYSHLSMWVWLQKYTLPETKKTEGTEPNKTKSFTIKQIKASLQECSC